MPSSEEVLTTLEARKEDLVSRGVRRLALFGSCARDEATCLSDLDFLVSFEKKTFDSYVELKEYLERLFGCGVDLVINGAVKPSLRARIYSEAIWIDITPSPG